jgi:hypothetical protein
MKRDIKDFVSQKPRSKYYIVNNLLFIRDVCEGKISNQIWAHKVIYGAHFLFDNF